MLALLCISFFCLLLPLLTLQLLDLGLVMFVPDTVRSFVIFLVLSSLHHLLLTLGRPIFRRGPRVGPVTWPWRAGTAPAMPPRSQREEAPQISGHEALFYLIIFIWQQRFKICCA